VNNKFGKNLIGAFYQPRAVITDTDLLSTLPPRELKAGYAEILKYGLLGDAVGHALELEAGYDGDLLHGEAVSIGMEMAFLFAAAEGICTQDDAARVSAHLLATQMPTLKDAGHLLANPEALLSHMGQDKKNEGGHLTLILPRAIGDTYVEKRADKAAVLRFLTHLRDNAA